MIHTINRESPEQYTVIVRGDSGNESIDIFDFSGTAQSVETPDGLDYITTAYADTALKALTIGDVTYITNTNKVANMSTEQTPPSVALNEALIFVNQAIESDYTVNVFPETSADVSVTHSAPGSPSASSIATAIAAGLNQVTGSSTLKYTPMTKITQTKLCS